MKIWKTRSHPHHKELGYLCPLTAVYKSPLYFCTLMFPSGERCALLLCGLGFLDMTDFCSPASPDAIWDTKGISVKPFPFFPISLLFCPVSSRWEVSGIPVEVPYTTSGWFRHRRTHIDTLSTAACWRWSKPQNQPSWGTLKIPHWKTLTLHLPAQGNLKHTGKCLNSPQLHNSNLATELANTRVMYFSATTGQMLILNMPLTSELMYFQLNL